MADIRFATEEKQKNPNWREMCPEKMIKIFDTDEIESML